MEDRAVAARAEAGVVDLRDAARAQPRRREAGDIDVRLGVRAVDELLGELLRGFFADFEAADADARAEPRLRRRHGVERDVDDALHRAAPAAVDVRDDVVADARDREAMGGFEGEGGADVRPERVAFAAAATRHRHAVLLPAMRDRHSDETLERLIDRA